MFVNKTPFGLAHSPVKMRNKEKNFCVFENDHRLAIHDGLVPGKYKNVTTITFKNSTVNMFMQSKNIESPNFRNISTHYSHLEHLFMKANNTFFDKNGRAVTKKGTFGSYSKLFYEKAKSLGYEPLRLKFTQANNVTLAYLSIVYPILGIGLYNHLLTNMAYNSHSGHVFPYLASKARRCSDLGEFCRRLFKDDSEPIKNAVSRYLNDFKLGQLTNRALAALSGVSPSFIFKEDIGSGINNFTKCKWSNFFKLLKYLDEGVKQSILKSNAIAHGQFYLNGWAEIENALNKFKKSDIEFHARALECYIRKDWNSTNKFLSYLQLIAEECPKSNANKQNKGVQAPYSPSLIISGSGIPAGFSFSATVQGSII